MINQFRDVNQINSIKKIYYTKIFPNNSSKNTLVEDRGQTMCVTHLTLTKLTIN